jgi:hypothetical protein
MDLQKASGKKQLRTGCDVLAAASLRIQTLWDYTVSFSQCFLAFRRILLPSSSGPRSLLELLDPENGGAG